MKKLSLPKLPSLPIETWEKLTSIQKVAVWVGIPVLLLAVYISLLYLPQKGECNNLEKEITNTQSQLERLKKVAMDKRRLEAELVEKQAKFEKVLQYLPDQKEIPSLLTNISNLGKEAGLEFLLFRPKEEIPREFYAEIPVEIHVTGSYHNVGTFFDRMSKLPRIVGVTDLSIGNAKPVEGEIILKTQCLAVTYRYMESSPKEVK